MKDIEKTIKFIDEEKERRNKMTAGERSLFPPVSVSAFFYYQEDSEIIDATSLAVMQSAH